MNSHGNISLEYLLVLLGLGLGVGIICFNLERALVDYYHGAISTLQRPVP